MDVLVALGTGISYFYSCYAIATNLYHQRQVQEQFFETSVFLIFFIILGKYLEALAKGQTSQAITKLLELTPDTAILVEFQQDNDKHTEKEISVALVQIGDVLRVNPGARIPSDGFVFKGSTFVDESMLTGESLPVSKVVGSEVLAGTVNTTSMILMKVAKVGEGDSTASNIVM
jgi:Cu+-exporting ATPase